MKRWPSLALFVGLAALWELVSRTGWANPVLVSSPSRIARAAAAMLRSPELAADLAYSFQVFALALVLAVALGTGTGLLIGWSSLAHRLVHPFVIALNAIPKIALMPLIVLWLGIGRPSGVFLAALMASFPVVIATSAGLRAIEREHVVVARAFGASPTFLIRSVVLPGVLPYLVSGLRVGINYALVGVILAEFFAASRGIGYRMLATMQNFEVDAFFVCLLLVAAFALFMTALLRALETRMHAWHPDAFEPAQL